VFDAEVMCILCERLGDVYHLSFIS
jgi:hypothetical protein